MTFSLLKLCASTLNCFFQYMCIYLHEREKKISWLHSGTHLPTCWKHQSFWTGKHELQHSSEWPQNEWSKHFAITFLKSIPNSGSKSPLSPLPWIFLIQQPLWQAAVLFVSTSSCSAEVCNSPCLSWQPRKAPSTSALLGENSWRDGVWISCSNSGWGKSPVMDEVLSGLASLITH